MIRDLGYTDGHVDVSKIFSFYRDEKFFTDSTLGFSMLAVTILGFSIMGFTKQGMHCGEEYDVPITKFIV
jgi:hypothetical protein